MRLSPKKVLLILLLISGFWAFSFYYPTISHSFADRLVSPNELTRHMAFRKLFSLEGVEKNQLIDDLLSYVAHPNWQTRRSALYILRVLGVKNKAYIAAATQGLKDKHPIVRREALVSLTAIGEDAISTLIQFINEFTPDVRQKIQRAIRRHGSMAINVLVQSIRQSNEKTRLEAAIILNQIEPSRKETLPIYLTEIASRPWDNQAYEILEALKKIGPQATEAIPILNRRLRFAKDGFKNHVYPRPALAETLSSIDPRPTTMEGLLWSLTHKNPIYRYRAAYELSKPDSPNRGADLALVTALNDSNVYVVARSFYTLQKIGMDKMQRLHDRMIPRLTKSLGQVSDVDHVEGYSEKLAPVLIRLLKNRNDNVKKNAVFQLTKINHPSAQLILEKLRTP